VNRPSLDQLAVPLSPRSFLSFAIRLTFLLLPAWSAGTLYSAEPLPAPSGTASTEITGTLVIVGGGDLPDAVLNRFLELAGGKSARLVIIPTASARADHPEQLKNWAFWKSQEAASVVLLHTRRREQANDPAFVKPLRDATGVWLSGGDQALLAAAYRGTLVEKELRRLLARGGVVGGTSAGAAVMSAVMIEGGNPARVGDGFGLLPGAVVDQHFTNRKRLDRLLGVLAKYPDYLGIGIDEETAAVVQGRKLAVLGNASVRICLSAVGSRPADVRILEPGQHADLQSLSQAVAARMPAHEVIGTRPAADPGEAPTKEKSETAGQK
jgi:cyanophycinase